MGEKTPASTATIATPLAVPKRRWGWAEIYWAKRDDGSETDWDTRYQRPMFEIYDEQAVMKDMLHLPGEYRDKALCEIADEFNGDTSQPGLDLYGMLSKEVERLEKEKDAIACTWVRQWIIVEVQPIIGVEFAFHEALPYFDLWAFMQPEQIGNTARMEDERGFVTDDIPRAGWFDARVGWLYHDDMWRAVMQENVHRGSEIALKPVREIPCRLVESDYPNSHVKHPSYGRGIRFQFKIPVTVRNQLTLDDLERKKGAIEVLRSRAGSGMEDAVAEQVLAEAGLPEGVALGDLSEKQINELLRIEVGSWLKIWVRNACYDWMNALPTDDRTEECMRLMNTLDQPKTHPNQLLKEPKAEVESDVTSSDFNDFFNDYREKAAASIQQKAFEDFYRQNSQHVQDGTVRTDWGEVNRAIQSQLQASVEQESDIVLWYGEEDPPDVPTEVKHTNIPDVWDETKESSYRYKVGNDTFRPCAFRNHTWVRNKVGEGPDLSDKCVHICLWPGELLDDLVRIPSEFFAFKREQNPWPQILGFTLIYGVLVKIFANAVPRLSPKEREALLEFLKESEFHKHAAVIACNGLPNWRLEWPEDKSYQDVCDAFNTRVENEEGPEATVLGLYETLLKSLAIAVVQAQGLAAVGKDHETVLQSYRRIGDKLGAASKAIKNVEGPTVSFDHVTEGIIELSLGEASYAKILKAGVIPSFPLIGYVLHTNSAITGSVGLDFSQLAEEAKRIAGQFAKKLSDPSVTAKLEKIIVKAFAATDGESGIYFDVGLATKLLAQFKDYYLDENDTAAGSGSQSAHPPESPYFKVIDDLLQKVGAEFGAYAKVTLKGDTGVKMDFKALGQSANGRKFFAFDKGAKAVGSGGYSNTLELSAEVPVTLKVFGAVQQIGKFSFTIARLTPHALAFLPGGFRGEWIRLDGALHFGNIAARGEVFAQEWSRVLPFTDTRMIYSHAPDYANAADGIKLSLGESLKTEAYTIAVPDDAIEAGNVFDVIVDIVGTDESFAPEVEERHNPLSSVQGSGRSQYDMVSILFIKMDFVKQTIKDGLVSGDGGAAGKLLTMLVGGEEQDVFVTQSYHGNPRRFDVSIRSPRISSLGVSRPSGELTTNDTIEVQFLIENWAYEDMPLYCMVYEQDTPPKGVQAIGATASAVMKTNPATAISSLINGKILECVDETLDVSRRLFFQEAKVEDGKSKAIRCTPVRGQKGKYACKIDLKRFKNLTTELKRWDWNMLAPGKLELVFMISLDKHGRLPLRHKGGEGNGLFSRYHEVTIVK